MNIMKYLNQNILRLSKYLLVIFSALSLAILISKEFHNTVFAQSTINKKLNLEIDSINTAPDKNHTQKIIQNELRNPTPTSPIEIKKEGIQSISQRGPITVSVSNAYLDFGQITSGNSVIRNIEYLTKSEFSDIQLVSFQNHPPKYKNHTLPDTTCDDGGCSESTASIWENNLTYGFGMRIICEANALCDNNTHSNYYRQLADKSKGENQKAILTATKSDEIKKIIIDLKLNISGTQPSGIYSNIATFITLPGY